MGRNVQNRPAFRDKTADWWPGPGRGGVWEGAPVRMGRPFRGDGKVLELDRGGGYATL